MTTQVNDTNGSSPVIPLNTSRTELEIQNRTAGPIYYNRFAGLNNVDGGIELPPGAKLTLLGVAAQRAFYAIHGQGGASRTLHYIADA